MLLIILTSCTFPTKDRQIEYVVISTPDLLLRECFLTPPPEVNWDDPNETVRELVSHIVDIVHDFHICADRIGAIREDRDRKISIYGVKKE